MNLTWIENEGVYIFDLTSHAQGLLSNKGSIWRQSYFCSNYNRSSLAGFARYSEGFFNTNDNVLKLELDIYELTLLLKMCFDTVKSTGIICLVGIGLGFGLTSWIIYKIYHRTKQKFDRREREQDPSVPESDCREGYLSVEESQDAVGLNGLVMGNNSSLRLSAGLNFDGSCQDDDTSGIRHRHAAPRESSVCASIVEKESGAYISRTAFQTTPIVSARRNGNEAREANTLAMYNIPNGAENEPTPSLSHKNNHCNSTLPLGNSLPPVMNDSGYLDIDITSTCDSILARRCSGDDSTLAPTPPACSENCLLSHQRGSSEISSLSDQQMRDLFIDSTVSDISSRRGSSELNVDEDVLRVEMDESVGYIGPDSLTACDQRLWNSVLLDEDSIAHSMASTNTTFTSGSPRDSISSQHILLSLSGKESFINDEPSSHSNSSPLSQIKLDSGNSRPSSVFSSPILGAIANRSRSSSMTSADVDLEASSMADMELNNDIEMMEQELEDIKLEIHQVEGKLDELMAVKTSNLYFNVDGMKKLTEVVLNSEDLNLTSSEIAKAFQILRKYRYSFATPDKKPTVRHSDAESITRETTSSKSLPYLDLADPYLIKDKERSITDWVDGLAVCSLEPLGEVTADLVMTEHRIERYAKCHPLYAKGYSMLMENYGFTKMCLLNIKDDATSMAAYSALIMHRASAEESNDVINIDRSYEMIEELFSSPNSYLPTWDFSHITSSTDTLSTMKLCLKTTNEQFKRLKSLDDQRDIVSSISVLLNHTANCRALIADGLRLLMFLRVNKLYQQYLSGVDMPLHGWLLFTNQSSHTPRYYFLNYIQNRTREMDQVDWSLLADVLGVRLQIFCPFDTNAESFHNIYPENNNSDKQCIPLAYHSNLQCAVLL